MHGANKSLPEELLLVYSTHREEIESALIGFSKVVPSEWFYEMCFCLLTPQSKAAHANLAVKELQRRDFKNTFFDTTLILKNPEAYIRFHNVKASRLEFIQKNWHHIHSILEDHTSPAERRALLVKNVPGLGLKEASHFLRNTGCRGLAILDRHLLTNLVRCGLYDEIPSVSTEKKYLYVEQTFIEYCKDIRLDMDVVDLIFWSAQTSYVFK